MSMPSGGLVREYTCGDISATKEYYYVGTTAGDMLVFKLGPQTNTHVFRCALPVCVGGLHCLTVLPTDELVCGGGDGALTVLAGHDMQWRQVRRINLPGRCVRT